MLFGATGLLLIRCLTIKQFKSPYRCVIFPLTQPQVANQKKSNDWVGVGVRGIQYPFYVRSLLQGRLSKYVRLFLQILETKNNNINISRPSTK